MKIANEILKLHRGHHCGVPTGFEALNGRVKIANEILGLGCQAGVSVSRLQERLAAPRKLQMRFWDAIAGPGRCTSGAVTGFPSSDGHSTPGRLSSAHARIVLSLIHISEPTRPY